MNVDKVKAFIDTLPDTVKSRLVYVNGTVSSEIKYDIYYFVGNINMHVLQGIQRKIELHPDYTYCYYLELVENIMFWYGAQPQDVVHMYLWISSS